MFTSFIAEPRAAGLTRVRLFHAMNKIPHKTPTVDEP